MMSELLELLQVWLAFIAVYILLPMGTARVLHPKGSLLSVLMLSALLGLSAQIILGRITGACTAQPFSLLTALPYLGLTAIGWLTALRRRSSYSDAKPACWHIFCIIVVGMILREVHPLSTAALGQSDAYSHLQFLRDILNQSALRNPLYPPGYHWTLALPTLLFQLDPYTVVRFAGAFYAGCTIGLVYLLGRQLAGTRAAPIAALLMAAFPGFQLLAKTGVGAFANQLGLLLVIGIFWLHVRGSDPLRMKMIGLSASIVALGLSVPIMLVDLLLILGTSLVATRLNHSAQRRQLLQYGLPAAVLALAAIALLLNTFPAEQWIAMANGLTGTPVAPTPGAALQDMLSDFFKLKRMGLGQAPMNGVGLLLLLGGSGVLIAGWRARHSPRILLGTWLVISALQTLFGVLQFSAYQRAGWMLMLGACLFGGLLWQQVFDRMDRRLPALSRWATAGLLAVCMVSFVHPPRHVPAMSPCEPLLTKELRRLTNDFKEPEGPENRWTQLGLLPQAPTQIILREFSRFHHRQGDLAQALLEDHAPLRAVSWRSHDRLHPLPEPGYQLVVIYETASLDPLQQNLQGLAVQDVHFNTFLAELSELYRVNDVLAAQTAAWNGPPLQRLDLGDLIIVAYPPGYRVDEPR